MRGGQEDQERENRESLWPKWQVYIRKSWGKGSEIPELERFRGGDRVRSAEVSQVGLEQKYQRLSRHCDALIGTRVSHPLGFLCDLAPTM